MRIKKHRTRNRVRNGEWDTVIENQTVRIMKITPSLTAVEITHLNKKNEVETFRVYLSAEEIARLVSAELSKNVPINAA